MKVLFSLMLVIGTLSSSAFAADEMGESLKLEECIFADQTDRGTQPDDERTNQPAVEGSSTQSV